MNYFLSILIKQFVTSEAVKDNIKLREESTNINRTELWRREQGCCKATSLLSFYIFEFIYIFSIFFVLVYNVNLRLIIRLLYQRL